MWMAVTWTTIEPRSRFRFSDCSGMRDGNLCENLDVLADADSIVDLVMNNGRDKADQ